MLNKNLLWMLRSWMFLLFIVIFISGWTWSGNIWPTPTRYVGDIPVYEKFDQLEPILRFDNDTTYVVNFWATWCLPCVRELPYFEALTDQYAGQKVKVILVSLDFPRQLESKLVPFVQERKLKSTVIALLDGKFNNWIDRVSPEWSGTLPATYIYRGDKHLFIGEAVHSEEELQTAIQSL